MGNKFNVDDRVKVCTDSWYNGNIDIKPVAKVKKALDDNKYLVEFENGEIQSFKEHRLFYYFEIIVHKNNDISVITDKGLKCWGSTGNTRERALIDASHFGNIYDVNDKEYIFE